MTKPIASMWFLVSVGISALASGVASAAAPTSPVAAPRVGDKVRIDFVHEVKGEKDPILRVRQSTGLLAFADSTEWRLASRRALRPGDPPLTTNLAVADFERVRISEGRSSARGAWMGLGLGIFAGATLAVLGGTDEDGGIFEKNGTALGWFIPLGGAAGALAGGAIKTDRWREYPVSEAFHLKPVGTPP